MMNMRPILIAGISMGITLNVSAQLPPMYEQFQLNQLTFNPAYAGSAGVLDANFFFQRHAVNFGNGSPATESITLHTPLANDKVGVGAKVYRDKIGATTTNFVGVDYAYRLHLSDHMTLAIGLEASLANYRVDVGELDAYNAGDPAFDDALESYWSPNAGAGLYLHSDNYYFGLSTISLFGLAPAEDPDINGTENAYFDQVNTIYGTAGALVPLTPAVALKPNLLVKMADSLPAQLDAGIELIWNNTFMIGSTYRTNNSLSFAAQYIYSADNKITRHEAGIGYAYNTAFGDDGLFLGPSHEIFLIYRFNRHNNNLVNPRFF